MAMVKEYTTKEGTTIQFFDDFYKDKSEAELKAADENVVKVANQLYREMAERIANGEYKLEHKS